MAPAEHPAERRIGAATLARLLGTLPPGAPTYRALAEAVRRCIGEGTLLLGTQLPSERELALAIGVSRTTTAAGYDQLRAWGFLHTRRGSGSVTALPGGPRPPGEAVLLAPSESADGVVDLAMAAPLAPHALHAAALAALDQLPLHLGSTGYTHLGLPALRELIAERYTRCGTPTTPDQVLVTTGAQQAISLLLFTLAGPGDRVVVEHPAYPHALTAVRATGARPVPVPVGTGGVDLDLLESAVRQAAPRVVHLTPDHHNPTGATLDAPARTRLRELAARHRTVVVGDETLTDLTLDGPAPPPFLGPSPGRWVVAIGSASKSFWGGLRVGWIRAHRDLITRLAQERAHHDLSSGLLDQLVVCGLLADQEALLAARRAELREQRDTLVAALTARLPWRVPVPAGGMSLWVDLGAPLSSALAAVAPSHGVRVVPGPVFGVDGSFDDRLRLPFARPAAELERGAAALAAAWSSLTGTAPGRALPPVDAIV